MRVNKLLLAFVVLLVGSSVLLSDIRIDQTAGDVATIATTNNAGVHTVRVDPTGVTTQPISGTVNSTPPTLTKGTQGATGFSVQALQDAGRSHVNFYAIAVASGTTTTETAVTLTKSADTGATSNAASFVVTSGKRYRITSMTFASLGNAVATAQTTVCSLRINTAGAVTTASTPITFRSRTATPATASAYDRDHINIGAGYEIVGDGTLQMGVTCNATFTTNAPTWDVRITGFEY